MQIAYRKNNRARGNSHSELPPPPPKKITLDYANSMECDYTVDERYGIRIREYTHVRQAQTTFNLQADDINRYNQLSHYQRPMMFWYSMNIYLFL